jgi:NADH dehydrogenase [ubiquinone] 1 alpha subcomplex assembly factor 7
VAVKICLKKRLESLSLTEQRENPVIEVCPGAIDVAKELSERIGADGGGALLIDYGDDKLAGDSLQVGYDVVRLYRCGCALIY